MTTQMVQALIVATVYVIIGTVSVVADLLDWLERRKRKRE